MTAPQSPLIRPHRLLTSANPSGTSGPASCDYAPLTEAAQAVLASSLEAHQRAREAREAIGREGMTVIGRDGQLRVHPLAAVERDARAAFLAGIKALGLELVPEKPKWDRYGNPTGWKAPR